jgi:hypothetical protein
MQDFTINTIQQNTNDHRSRLHPAQPQIRVQQIVSVNGKNFTDCSTD